MQKPHGAIFCAVHWNSLQLWLFHPISTLSTSNPHWNCQWWIPFTVFSTIVTQQSAIGSKRRGRKWEGRFWVCIPYPNHQIQPQSHSMITRKLLQFKSIPWVAHVFHSWHPQDDTRTGGQLLEEPSHFRHLPTGESEKDALNYIKHRWETDIMISWAFDPAHLNTKSMEQKRESLKDPAIGKKKINIDWMYL